MADAVRHVLVVAGRTAVSPALRTALLRRAGDGPAEFTLLLPEDGHDDPAQVLLHVVERLRADGLDVAGQVGPADPLAAVTQVWDPSEFDEIVLSTLPPGRSQWLASDLPGRIERVTGVPVTHVAGTPPAAPGTGSR